MRITIVESEIKEAIVAFVASQLTIKEGQEITVDFKATRGEDGATAEISITTPTVKSPAKTNRKAVPTLTAKAESAEEAKADIPEQPEEVTESVNEPQTVDSATETKNASVEEAQPTDNVSAEAQAEDPSSEPEEATSVPQTGSLFAKLQRPKND